MTLEKKMSKKTDKLEVTLQKALKQTKSEMASIKASIEKQNSKFEGEQEAIKAQLRDLKDLLLQLVDKKGDIK